ncbi:putative trehalose-phosphate phosphatase J [Dorcoceras hygrometricum]|uniref:Putative trehalose-phosphate phosphatase J n=1 Tax=Dorcoceras hygrometricum TaxID=472368 RepID=A0A2Z7B8V8_9LAMI|nr:putative trehalose-phosphate phosphatase J [Dorcoceras hygrometricum]
MMNSNRICPADGSQYKDSAVGLVFMESAAGLAMETSRVKSVVRNQARAKWNQLEHNKPAGTITTSCKRLRVKMNQLVQELRSEAGIRSKKKILGASYC